MTPIEEIQHCTTLLQDAQRVVVCPPEVEERIKSELLALGLAELNKVIGSKACPENTLYLINPNYIDSLGQESFQHRRLA